MAVPRSSEIKFTKFYLPNGMKCILYKRPEIHSVNISVVVNSGALDEDENSNGVFHLIEHLAFDGTEKFESWDKVNDFLNNISGNSNAYTSYDHTKYYGTFPSQYSNEAMEYLSQLVFHPLHKQVDLDKERDIVLDEMKRYEDSIGYKIYRSFIENRFETKDSNFCYEIIGTEKNLKSFTIEDIRRNFEKAYTPSNMELYVVGNFKTSDLRKAIKKYFYDDLSNKKFGAKPERAFRKSYPKYSKFNINTDQKLDLSQYYLTLTFPSLEFALTSQKDRILLGFLTSIIASSQYQNSILWKRLREELGIVYGINSWTHGMFNRAVIGVETSFNPEFLETVLKELYQGINQVKSGTYGEDIFKVRQKRITDTEMMRHDNPSNILSWIVDQEDEFEVHKSNISIEEYLSIINEFKFEDVIDLANKLFDWNSANITVVSNDDSNRVKMQIENTWQKILQQHE
jgi:predicted Zn-dependent peptidase